MDVLVLMFRDEPLREFELRERPLEVGRGAGCDIVVHDPAVGERHWLVMRQGGAVWVHDHASGSRRPIAAGRPLTLGAHHALVRVQDVTKPTPIGRLRTAPIAADVPPARLGLLIGEGAEARRVAIEDRPLVLGTCVEADVQVSDRTVSARHCRLEPTPDGVFVRDLESRNGTSVDGVFVRLARIGPGSRVRVGRTDLRVVARGPGGEPAVGMIARSDAMRAVLAEVDRLARLSWPVLVSGESGVGKEGLARALHARGPRRAGPFVAVNAGGMPASLVESELFGHERGAFTGADAARRGVFEQAHGGTLFLDEIGELPLELQARLLRVLESWEIRRLGSERAVPVDVRLVCATHRDLFHMVKAGDFRQDLYYRVVQLGLEVPPLRARPDDIAPLARHFLDEVAEQLGPRELAPDALARLMSHRWPGNVRELRNVCRQAAARAATRRIERRDVEAILIRHGAPAPRAPAQLQELVASYGGNLTATARALGIPRSTLRDRLRREGDDADAA